VAPNLLLAAADQVATLSSAPRQPTGRMLPDYMGAVMPGLPGWDVLAAQAQQIDVPELRWPHSVRTYEAMRRDSQIQGLLTSVFLPIRHMEWYLDPGDAQPGTVAEEIAADLGLPLLGDPEIADGAGIDFDDHLRLALLALALGHQFFEEAGDIVGTGNAQRYRLRTLLQYPQTSIAAHQRQPRRDAALGAAEHRRELPRGAGRPAAGLRLGPRGRQLGRPAAAVRHLQELAGQGRLVRSDVVAVRRFSGIPIAKATTPDVGPEGRPGRAAHGPGHAVR
jgi:hypothetical protein